MERLLGEGHLINLLKHAIEESKKFGSKLQDDFGDRRACLQITGPDSGFYPQVSNRVFA